MSNKNCPVTYERTYVHMRTLIEMLKPNRNWFASEFTKQRKTGHCPEEKPLSHKIYHAQSHSFIFMPTLAYLTENKIDSGSDPLLNEYIYKDDNKICIH